MLSKSEKINRWIRRSKAVADRIERVKKDPMQNLTDKEVDDCMKDLLEEFDAIFNTGFLKEYNERD